MSSHTHADRTNRDLLRHIASEIAGYLIQVQSTERESLELESHVNYGKLYAIALFFQSA